VSESSPTDVNQDGIPAGFEAVCLIEALNGPTLPHCAPVVNADGTLRSLQFSDSSPHGTIQTLLNCLLRLPLLSAVSLSVS